MTISDRVWLEQGLVGESLPDQKRPLKATYWPCKAFFSYWNRRNMLFRGLERRFSMSAIRKVRRQRNGLLYPSEVTDCEAEAGSRGWQVRGFFWFLVGAFIVGIASAVWSERKSNTNVSSTNSSQTASVVASAVVPDNTVVEDLAGNKKKTFTVIDSGGTVQFQSTRMTSGPVAPKSPYPRK